MANNANNIQKTITNRVEQETKKIQRAAEQTTWEILKDLEKRAPEKWKELMGKYFDTISPTEYYDRTGTTADAIEFKATHGGSHYNLNLYYNVNNVKSFAPPDRRKFATYAYSWGGGQGSPKRGMRLEPQVIEGLVVDIVWQAQKDFNILGKFQDWVEEEFSSLFNKNFRVNLDRL